MAKKNTGSNLTVDEKLEYLLELQSINSKLDEIKKLQGELPLEVEALEGDINKLEERIEKINEEKKELEVSLAKFQSQIKESEAHIEKYTRQQDDVKNNREFEALAREIELQKLDIQLAKKRIYETQAKLEQKEETLSAANDRIADKRKDLELKNEELEKITSKTEKDEKKYLNKEKRARKKMPESLLVSYDRTRNAYKNGLAVVTIERNACGGCFSEIPPQVQLEMTQRKRIITCEHCGRVLMTEKIEEPEVQEE